MTANGTSTTRRRRRTQAEMYNLRAELLSIVELNEPMTVRQVFYQAVTAGLVDKTETQYRSTVARLLAEMRRDGELPWEWIADNTRWQRKPKTYRDLNVYLDEAKRFYRRALWADQDAYVEIWLEKDALAGVLYSVTAEWDVPLMVTRGYPSISFLYSAAEAIADQGRPCFLYYFGDYDPSGVDIPRTVEASIREFAPEADLTFQRVAVNPDQIAEMNLPTRPTKASDSRSRRFKGESVEVDAIPPQALRDLAHSCIVQHIDQDALRATEAAEESERDILGQLAGMVA
jgi:hypothetical protein